MWQATRVNGKCPECSQKREMNLEYCKQFCDDETPRALFGDNFLSNGAS